MKRIMLAALAIAAASWTSPGAAQDRIRVAIGQRGNWDTIATQFAVDQGIMRRHNLEAAITWTQASSSSGCIR